MEKVNGTENTGYQEEGPADLAVTGHRSKLRPCKGTERQQGINRLEASSVLWSSSLLMHKPEQGPELHGAERLTDGAPPCQPPDNLRLVPTRPHPWKKSSPVARVPMRFGEEIDWSL